jgi:hypothetical protein
LSDLVCPTLPEDKIEACIDFVDENWAAMAPALFAYPNTLTDICGALGYCTKFQRVNIFSCLDWLIIQLPVSTKKLCFHLPKMRFSGSKGALVIG